jgi:ATP-dependent Clp protease ATP-binding subunit ClpA
MYSFERFTERAKKVLTLAQEEAERSRHNYIGTEHLLVGLLREGDGLAAKVLNNLGVEIGTVRQVIESVLGRPEDILIQQITPTSRVKKVIEISFEEARRMDHKFVGTEHLLLGLMIEGEGIAAHVLKDLGVTLEQARAEIERLLAGGEQEEASEAASHRAGAPGRRFSSIQGEVLSHIGGRPLGADTAELLRLTSDIAASENAPGIGLDHLQRAMGSADVMALLQSSARIRQVQAAKEEAVAAQDYGTAAARRAEEQRLQAERAEAGESWRRSLGGST